MEREQGLKQKGHKNHTSNNLLRVPKFGGRGFGGAGSQIRWPRHFCFSLACSCAFLCVGTTVPPSTLLSLPHTRLAGSTLTVVQCKAVPQSFAVRCLDRSGGTREGKAPIDPTTLRSTAPPAPPPHHRTLAHSHTQGFRGHGGVFSPPVAGGVGDQARNSRLLHEWSGELLPSLSMSLCLQHPHAPMDPAPHIAHPHDGLLVPSPMSPPGVAGCPLLCVAGLSSSPPHHLPPTPAILE